MVLINTRTDNIPYFISEPLVIQVVCLPRIVAGKKVSGTFSGAEKVPDTFSSPESSM
jgi:hypothetical protein